MNKGNSVICLDNLSSGSKENIDNWRNHSSFKFIEHDITKIFEIEVDYVWHLACIASPFNYMKDPINLTKTNFLGTLNSLQIAKKSNAKFIFTSSSEIYGFTHQFPQKESDWGIVNPIGIRSCYSEGKRLAESLCFDFQRIYNLDISIARIFNAYGPRMRREDKRVVSEFIFRALDNKNLEIFGDGNQTRSFCFVEDIIEGLMQLPEKRVFSPVNIGSTDEISINQLASIVLGKINSKSKITHKKPREEEIYRRLPSIDLINKICGWEPKIDLNIGLEKTIEILKTY